MTKAPAAMPKKNSKELIQLMMPTDSVDGLSHVPLSQQQWQHCQCWDAAKVANLKVPRQGATATIAKSFPPTK